MTENIDNNNHKGGYEEIKDAQVLRSMIEHNERRIAEYDRSIAEYDRRIAEFDRRIAEYDRREAEHKQRMAEHQQRIAELRREKDPAQLLEAELREGERLVHLRLADIGHELRYLRPFREHGAGGERLVAAPSRASAAHGVSGDFSGLGSADQSDSVGLGVTLSPQASGPTAPVGSAPQAVSVDSDFLTASTPSSQATCLTVSTDPSTDPSTVGEEKGTKE